jgi:hypothetical protein
VDNGWSIYYSENDKWGKIIIGLFDPINHDD